MLRTALFLSGMATAALASSLYSVSVIQIPSGFTAVTMTGINASGQAAGYGTIGGITQAFIGSPSGSAPIPVPVGSGWDFSQGYGINDSGQVVGAGRINFFNYQAFIGTAAGSTLVPIPGGYAGSLGYGVNNSGQVAGWLLNGLSAPQEAFVGSTAIPLPAGWNNANGNGVNATGAVAGYGANGSSVTQAFIYNGSTSNAIPVLSGWTQTQGWALNDSGLVAGWGNNGTNSQAFIGTASGMTAIPLPVGATYSYARGGSINDAGLVVGQSDQGGWIWDQTDGTVLLSGLVPTGWVINYAWSISNTGIILAEGSFNGSPNEYVELVSSTPEPATWELGGMGLLLTVLARRTILRRR